MASSTSEEEEVDYDYYIAKHIRNGKYEEALCEAKNKLQQCFLSRNSDDEEMAESYTVLGEIHALLGDIDTAHVRYRQASSLQQNIQNKQPNRKSVAISYQNIAGICQKRGLYVEAVHRFGESLNLLLHIFKDRECRVILLLRREIGEFYLEIADYHTAFKHLDIARKNYIPYLPSMDKGTRRSFSNVHNSLGDFYMDVCKYDKASSHYQEALSIREMNEPEDMMIDTLRSYNGLCRANIKQADYQNAHSSLSKSITACEKVFGAGFVNIQQVDMVATIATLNYHVGQYIDELDYLNRALQLYNQAMPNYTHSKIADIYDKIGDAHTALGEFMTAHSFHITAHKAREKVYKERKIHANIANGMEKSGLVYCKQGRYERAVAALNEALEMRVKFYEKVNKNHPSIARSHQLLADIDALLSKHQQALSRYTLSLTIQRNVFNQYPNHEDIALNYCKMADVHRLQGEYDKARDYYKQAMDVYKEVQHHVLSHPSCAKVLSGTASVKEDQGLLEEALKDYQKSYDIYYNTFQSSHPDVARVLLCIANCQVKLSLYKEALGNLEKAVGMFKKIYDDRKHRDVGLAHTHVGNLYMEKEDFEKATEHHSHALFEFKALLGGSESTTDGKEIKHPDIANAYNNLGMAFCFLAGKENSTKANEFLTRSLKMRISIYGQDELHLDVSESHFSIGQWNLRSNKFSDAIESYVKCMNIRKSVYGTEMHLKIAEVYGKMGEAYNERGENPQALDCCRVSLDIREKVLGKSNESISIAVDSYYLANMHVKLSQFQQAYPFYVRACDIFKRMPCGAKQTAYLASTYYNIALIGQNVEGIDEEDILQYYTLSCELYEKISSSHPQLGMAYENLGNLKFSQCEYVDAYAFHKKSLDVRKQYYPEKNVEEVATSHEDVARTCFRLGYYKLALCHFQKALAVKNVVYSGKPANTDIAKTYHDIGTVFEQLGDNEKASRHHITALTIFKTVHQEETDHPDILRTYCSLGLSFTMSGELEESFNYLRESLAGLKEFYGIEMEECKGNWWPDISLCCRYLALLYFARHSYAEALEYLNHAVRILKDNAVNHPDIALNHYHIGRVYVKQRLLQEALASFNTALEIWKTFFRNHPDIANCYREIGVIYETEMKYNEALDNYDTSMKMNKLFYDKEDKNFIIYNDDMVSVYQKLQQWKDCFKHVHASLNIKLKVFGTENNEDVAMDFEKIADLHKLLGQDQESKHYHWRAEEIRKAIARSKDGQPCQNESDGNTTEEMTQEMRLVALERRL